MTTVVAAYVYTILMGIVILFQLCLTLGLPWGEASMGGKYPGKYPTRMRVVSFINVVILSFIALIVLVKADILFPQFKSLSLTAIWFVVGFSVVAVILNTITPSKIERKLWAPVTVVQLITCLIVALN